MTLPKPSPSRKNSRTAPPAEVEHDLGLDTDYWLRAYRKSVKSHPSIESALHYFKRIFDDAPAPYLVTNLSLVVTDANRAAQQMLRRSLVILRQKPLVVVVSREERSALRTMAADLINGHASITRPLRVQPHGLEPLDTVVSASVCRDADGIPECVFWIFLHPLENLNEDLLEEASPYNRGISDTAR